jgi:hypothetical protein
MLMSGKDGTIQVPYPLKLGSVDAITNESDVLASRAEEGWGRFDRALTRIEMANRRRPPSERSDIKFELRYKPGTLSQNMANLQEERKRFEKALNQIEHFNRQAEIRKTKRNKIILVC